MTAVFSSNVSEDRGQGHKLRLAEGQVNQRLSSYFTYLTPLVWKKLILAGEATLVDNHAARENVLPQPSHGQAELVEKTVVAARHLLETYIEHRSGRKMKALALI